MYSSSTKSSLNRNLGKPGRVQDDQMLIDKFTKRSPGTQAAAASAAAAVAAAAAPNSNAATTLNQYSQKQETMSVTELLDEMHALKLKVNTLGLDDEEVQNHLFVQNVSHNSKDDWFN